MLNTFFDAVVMLTWSDWHKEPRSNRYHYASRFAQQLPVIFVQPDLLQGSYHYEETELKNVTILHLYERYGKRQTEIFNLARGEKKIIRPLVWTYNFLFNDIIQSQYSPLKVYHATEDYFSTDFKCSDEMIRKLKEVLRYTDLLISVSEGVKESYHEKGGFKGNSLVLTNGCDYHFWEEGERQCKLPTKKEKIVLYQGGINYRIDYQLLTAVVSRMPDWEFRFCGREVVTLGWDLKEWKSLCRFSNVKYLGQLSPSDLRDELYRATVGIIPFIRNEFIIERSFPLKAFEYLACGLPVVSVPIKALLPYANVFNFAQTSEQFIEKITYAAPSRYDSESIKVRRAEAQKKDYDENFRSLLSFINSKMESPKGISATPLNVLILYDKNSIHVPTVREHLESFSRYSENNIFYVNATTRGGNPADYVKCQIDMSIFDAVILHYSVRLSLTWHLSESFAENLRRYNGLKILFIQDEYDYTNTACNWINDLGIQLVFTCVPYRFLEIVYPKDKFPHVEFIQTITGFVPIKSENFQNSKPHHNRKYLIGYRGRALPYWYGTLGQEKIIIGKRMREICESKNIRVNIEWDDSKRIYGDDWYRFLEDCNATLGTESGSNVFDFDGEISRKIQEALKINPNMTFAEAYEKYLKDIEGKIIMNQISPKIFEAISVRTALILFEGNYSGIIKPGEHFIALRKDFSNVDEVLDRVQDYEYISDLTNRAYWDVIQSGENSYKRFIQDFDRIVSERSRGAKAIDFFSILIAYQSGDEKKISPLGPSMVFSKPVDPQVLQDTFKEVSSPSPTRVSSVFVDPELLQATYTAFQFSDSFEQKIILSRYSKFMTWLSLKANISKKMYYGGGYLWRCLPYKMRQRIKPVLKPIIYKILGGT